jgi:hypothetical protein
MVPFKDIYVKNITVNRIFGIPINQIDKVNEYVNLKKVIMEPDISMLSNNSELIALKPYWTLAISTQYYWSI